ncbi:MAG: NAD(P)H-dependent glycerol-3-phosphate dehydrogenase [Candidatus Marinimicrobia bacterium]|jgi:glycerol-3-phosphate dehydrogenase (NAD(P)+)|nr:NAD(P)H-dependent glycerol-3-phosphate dehydrogenase [Candidatus Neomarinimicrobiota bacterium]MDP6499306.1 NAD(P)H-dependent glycerol-3-phosphate dehydrogenase [Candidatus Neomarinimicrobiota bacterium]MDP6726302.1 NAD(P)H-dependent glycerol-3-phosphate dehydrogenase [Candidatus Neomarinimicrobiota bacterium]|tara:strand:+ start:3892 stop:4884 length:993 start_codon:yes stop_codon:yes gene_type:complete
MSKISILGTGSWGSAIGESLAHNDHNVILWQRDFQKANLMQNDRKHTFIDNFTFSDNINFTSDLEFALDKADIIVVAVPSHSVRDLISHANTFISNSVIIVNISKGLEIDSLLTMSAVIREETPGKDVPIVSLYGPSHAEEVVKKIPTTLVAASTDENARKMVQKIFSSSVLRVYTNNDILGIELGGSLKNVIAIAAGICDGIGFGDNTKAAILTRGIAEMTRLGVAMGAKEKTFAGLSGIGDLFVTCSSKHSRNRFVGEEIGKGRKLDEILSEMKMVAEGVKTAKAIYQLCQKHIVEMPISLAVYNVLYNNKDPRESVNELMSRDLVSE